MSKELEAFEHIKNITYDRTDLYGIEVFSEDLDTIEKALKRILELERENFELMERVGFNATYKDEEEDTQSKLKALESISKNFRLVGNCLHAKNEYAESGWIFEKEIENEEELEAWKEVLGNE